VKIVQLSTITVVITLLGCGSGDGLQHFDPKNFKDCATDRCLDRQIGEVIMANTVKTIVKVKGSPNTDLQDPGAAGHEGVYDTTPGHLNVGINTVADFPGGTQITLNHLASVDQATITNKDPVGGNRLLVIADSLNLVAGAVPLTQVVNPQQTINLSTLRPGANMLLTGDTADVPVAISILGEPL